MRWFFLQLHYVEQKNVFSCQIFMNESHSIKVSLKISTNKLKERIQSIKLLEFKLCSIKLKLFFVFLKWAKQHFHKISKSFLNPRSRFWKPKNRFWKNTPVLKVLDLKKIWGEFQLIRKNQLLDFLTMCPFSQTVALNIIHNVINNNHNLSLGYVSAETSV
jgi:hypothetical protein